MMDKACSMRLRYAPSPTGDIQFGNARTALFCFLMARQNKGSFILRIEDTDKERSTKESEESIIKDLLWMGIHWDEFYRQSERTEIYEEALNYLIENDFVYGCHCDQGRDCQCQLKKLPCDENHAIRFKTPNKGTCIFEDIIAGTISIPWEEIEDFAISRKNRAYTFHLCVTVDDIKMGITHIIRGKDHISNMAKQIALCQAFGVPHPKCAHLPLVMGSDGKKLSKRQLSASIAEARRNGILSEAVISTLVRLGWSYGNQEMFTRQEMLELFDITKVQKSPAVFDYKKLLHANNKFLSTMDNNEILSRLLDLIKETNSSQEIMIQQNKTVFSRAIPFLKVRSRTLWDLIEIGDFTYKIPQIYHIPEGQKAVLENYVHCIKESTTIDQLQQKANQLLTQSAVTFKDFASSLREILTGKPISPNIFEVIYILGPEESARRIQRSLGEIT